MMGLHRGRSMSERRVRMGGGVCAVLAAVMVWGLGLPAAHSQGCPPGDPLCLWCTEDGVCGTWTPPFPSPSVDPGFFVEEDGSIFGHYEDHSPGFDMGLVAAEGVEVFTFDMSLFGDDPPGVAPGDAAAFGHDLVTGYYDDPATFQPFDVYQQAFDAETAAWEHSFDCLYDDPPCLLLALVPVQQGWDGDVIVGDHPEQAVMTGQDPVNPASGECVHRAV